MKTLAAIVVLVCLSVSGWGQSLAHEGTIQFDAAGAKNWYGSLLLNQVSAPGAPQVTPRGTTGATTYSYQIVANDFVGHTTGGSTGTTTQGNATLTGVNYNQLTWTPVIGAVSYSVYRVTGGVTGKLTTTVGVHYNDTGLAGDGTSPPGSNTTGEVRGRRFCDVSNTESCFAIVSSLSSSCDGTTGNYGDAAVVSLLGGGQTYVCLSGTWLPHAIWVSNAGIGGSGYILSYPASRRSSVVTDNTLSNGSACGSYHPGDIALTGDVTFGFGPALECIGSGRRTWRKIIVSSDNASTFDSGSRTGSGKIVGDSSPTITNLTFTSSSAQIGSGPTFTNTYTFSYSVGGGTVNANTCTSGDVTSGGSGIAAGDHLIVQFSTPSPDGIIHIYNHSVASGVNITTCNVTTGNLTDAGVTISGLGFH